jgi:hypothetical protein
MIYINGDFEYNVAKPSYNHLTLKIPNLCGVSVLYCYCIFLCTVR